MRDEDEEKIACACVRVCVFAGVCICAAVQTEFT